MGRAPTWSRGTLPPQQPWQPQWSPDMLAEMYYSWNNMAGGPAAAVAAAAAAAEPEAASAGPAGAPGDWRMVVQAAAAAASRWEIQKLNGVPSQASGEVSFSLLLILCLIAFVVLMLHEYLSDFFILVNDVT